MSMQFGSTWVTMAPSPLHPIVAVVLRMTLSPRCNGFLLAERTCAGGVGDLERRLSSLRLALQCFLRRVSNSLLCCNSSDSKFAAMVSTLLSVMGRMVGLAAMLDDGWKEKTSLLVVVSSSLL